MHHDFAMRLARKIPVALFIIAIPLFLITNSVSWAVNDLRLYRHGFDKYDVSLVTGIDRDGLVAAAREIRSYFNSPGKPLEIQATVFGEDRELFNRREVMHMEDVKRLIWGVYGVDIAAAAYLVAFVALGFLIYRRLFAAALSRYLLWGSGLTLGVVLLVGVFALSGFDSLFLFFHETSFSNDFWRLNSNTDFLVMMFPEGFWFDATMFVALATVGQAVAIGVLTGGFLALQRRRARGKGTPPLPHLSKAAGA